MNLMISMVWKNKYSHATKTSCALEALHIIMTTMIDDVRFEKYSQTDFLLISFPSI
jgi:hypothetical protein